jgi:Amt family ammonium transporter
LAIGFIASFVSNLVVSKFPKGKVDDALDVFACHGVGGMVGMLMTGIFATSAVNAAVVENGLFYGETALFMKHILALAIVSAFAFSVSYLLLIITDKIIPLRVNEEEERLGLDLSQHDESLAE